MILFHLFVMIRVRFKIIIFIICGNTDKNDIRRPSENVKFVGFCRRFVGICRRRFLGDLLSCRWYRFQPNVVTQFTARLFVGLVVVGVVCGVSSNSELGCARGSSRRLHC